MKTYQVYIARCSDGSLYTGFSDDPVRRCRVHNSGKGAKYTRSRLPVELVWVSEPYYDVSTAMSFERSIKKMSRKKKLKIVTRETHACQRLDDQIHAEQLSQANRQR